MSLRKLIFILIIFTIGCGTSESTVEKQREVQTEQLQKQYQSKSSLTEIEIPRAIFLEMFGALPDGTQTPQPTDTMDTHKSTTVSTDSTSGQVTITTKTQTNTKTETESKTDIQEQSKTKVEKDNRMFFQKSIFWLILIPVLVVVGVIIIRLRL